MLHNGNLVRRQYFARHSFLDTKRFFLSLLFIKKIDLSNASDMIIFKKAKIKGNVILITKDQDFCSLLQNLKAPPKIIWLSFGNCSNDKMKAILERDLNKALGLLNENDIVEISG